IILAPYTSKVLVDAGDAPLTLLGINPSHADVDKAVPFTLTVTGLGFTPSSVVRWNSSDRPTTYIDDTQLTAEISAADVSMVGAYPVTVYDPAGGETAARLFYVWEEVFEVWLPLVDR
ncbi:MAG: hypothetical protein GYA34_05255, partial [Chloroflexi bacterium]|nr:hypothetical protein [Chloroflexota bacterium]